MLPDSKFPVTGGIMQNDFLPRVQLSGLNGSVPVVVSKPNYLGPCGQSTQHFVEKFETMTVKQETREDEEHNRDTTDFRPSISYEAVDSIENKKRQIVRQDKSMEPQRDTVNQNSPDVPSSSRTPRPRRKARWKLKFHHQALPPEYLDHYEASLAQEASNNVAFNHQNAGINIDQTGLNTTTCHLNNVSIRHMNPENSSLGSIQSHFTLSKVPCPKKSLSNNNISIDNNQNHINNFDRIARPPMKYSDLPYMGEITLDNNKPRRGRKPKKADICHLIYKNYGTILPGTPGVGSADYKKSPESFLSKEGRNPYFQRSDIQNKIISSLLEKRLTQERRELAMSESQSLLSKHQQEPLNLCIRDLNHLKIRIPKKISNLITVKSEIACDAGDDLQSLVAQSELDSAVKSNHKELNSESRDLQKFGINNKYENTQASNSETFSNSMSLHSQLMLYQKLMQEGRITPIVNHHKDQVDLTKSPDSLDSNNKSPTAFHDLHFDSPPQNLLEPQSPRPKRNYGNLCSGQPKKKRSAIFIPPVPIENNNNPTTEVSICKFKFTGGAKPTLQEKKSLSVDSGGNFRYYSGTGDKSMRGYEFFPREALQQSAGNNEGCSAEVFLNAAAERIPQTPSPNLTHPEFSMDDMRRKRKTRKSIQREKLEQTFKEKGFLIQTQQLESAEGATYCKFRQLRKFTRYLFRSWKDYLPENVTEGNPESSRENTYKDIEHSVPGPSSPYDHLDMTRSLVDGTTSVTLS